ncbi:MAG: bifunctional nuclease family protein [Bacteroidaceae bacterium]|nr:bifunctional nuclease family protein [Bacteroidaceae bacterium]
MTDQDNRIELKVQEISRIESKGEQYIVLLKERRGLRRMPLPVSKHEVEELLKVMNLEPSRHGVWAQVFKELTGGLDIILEDAVITEVIHGHYVAELHFLQYGLTTTVRINAIQALILTLSQRSPFYIDKQLMEKQYVRLDDVHKVSLPLNTLSIQMLEDALQTAIKEERYELASHLRDELKRRK